MPRDERLKKRTAAAPQSHKNDAYGLNTDGGLRSDTPGRPSSTSRRRVRRRRKGSMFKNFAAFKSLKRIARSFALKNGINPRSAVSTTVKMTFFLLCLVIASFIFFGNNGNAINKGNLRTKVGKLKRRKPEFKISFPTKSSGKFSVSLFDIDAIESGPEGDTDYGGLTIENVGRDRKISDLDFLLASEFRHPDKNRDDDGNDGYMAFDDDFIRGTEGTMNKNPTNKVCHRTSGHRTNFQNCNTIFESELLSNHVKYLKYVVKRVDKIHSYFDL
jgi:hypothetical protein